MTDKIGMIGGGSWGTALAILLSKKGYNVDLWLRNKKQIEEINLSRENVKYLPGVIIPTNVNVTNDLEEVISNKDILILSVPSHSVREVLIEGKKYIKSNQVIVNDAKGIENGSLMTVSQIVKEILPENEYAILSGPSHAEEVARDMPTTVVTASSDRQIAEYVQDVFMTPKFRVYSNPDVIGVELGGSLKNVIALGAGISDGLEYGDNTKAALMTRGSIEMARLGVKMGGNYETFAGLAGIGDLIVTCTSIHSRNRKAGILIGQGESLEDAISKIGMVVEGIRTTKSAYELSEKHGVIMPITEEIFQVLYSEKDVKNSVVNLMLRDKKHEMEDIAQNLDINW